MDCSFLAFLRTFFALRTACSNADGKRRSVSAALLDNKSRVLAACSCAAISSSVIGKVEIIGTREYRIKNKRLC